MLLFPLTSTFLSLCFAFWPHKTELSSDQWTAHNFSQLPTKAAQAGTS